MYHQQKNKGKAVKKPGSASYQRRDSEVPRESLHSFEAQPQPRTRRAVCLRRALVLSSSPRGTAAAVTDGVRSRVTTAVPTAVVGENLDQDLLTFVRAEKTAGNHCHDACMKHCACVRACVRAVVEALCVCVRVRVVRVRESLCVCVYVCVRIFGFALIRYFYFRCYQELHSWARGRRNFGGRVRTCCGLSVICIICMICMIGMICMICVIYMICMIRMICMICMIFMLSMFCMLCMICVFCVICMIRMIRMIRMIFMLCMLCVLCMICMLCMICVMICMSLTIATFLTDEAPQPLQLQPL